jgi:hypothetical protein
MTTGQTRKGKRPVGGGLVRAAAPLIVASGLAMSSGHCEKSDAGPSSPAPAPAAASVAQVDPCGDKGLPDCPTQAWMKAALQPFVMANDTPRLAEAFEHLAKAAPTGYADWASISRAGAKAANAGNLAAAKQSCGDCHNLYRARFRGELRHEKLL